MTYHGMRDLFFNFCITLNVCEVCVLIPSAVVALPVNICMVSFISHMHPTLLCERCDRAFMLKM